MAKIREDIPLCLPPTVLPVGVLDGWELRPDNAQDWLDHSLSFVVESITSPFPICDTARQNALDGVSVKVGKCFGDHSETPQLLKKEEALSCCFYDHMLPAQISYQCSSLIREHTVQKALLVFKIVWVMYFVNQIMKVLNCVFVYKVFVRIRSFSFSSVDFLKEHIWSADQPCN